VRARRIALLALVVACVGCPKKQAAQRECFNVVVSDNSKGTEALFASRHCQGGGVTWGALLHVLAARMGRVEAVEDVTPGWTGGVYTMNGRTRFSIDDEGDAAQFCAAGPILVAEMRRAYERLNHDAGELKRAMAETTALQLECAEADGTAPKVPALLPPPFEAR